MIIELLYFDDCPNWTETRDRLVQVLGQRGLLAETVELVLITSTPEAAARDFAGSPTILINGADPYPRPAQPAGLSCRLYSTPQGMRGSPSLDQIETAIDQALSS